ncbi:hypothetical protein HANVADRAFT_12539, partial [Hanseniaspora valbyensis NRRL Y-1626]
KSKKFDENKPWKSHVDLGYITSEEKKRYEGIWVSNKNRFLEMLPQQNHHLKKIYKEEEEDFMVNFVVYEIYNRSNLPPRILCQIYYMIDLKHDGTITKNSFIVGMWLIDQCLYGKKLPAVIPDLVWDSVEKMVIGVDVSHKSIQKNKKRNARREIKELKRHEKIV